MSSFILGFAIGAALAAIVCTLHNKRNDDRVDEILREARKPMWEIKRHE